MRYLIFVLPIIPFMHVEVSITGYSLYLKEALFVNKEAVFIG